MLLCFKSLVNERTYPLAILNIFTYLLYTQIYKHESRRSQEPLHIAIMCTIFKPSILPLTNKEWACRCNNIEKVTWKRRMTLLGSWLISSHLIGWRRRQDIWQQLWCKALVPDYSILPVLCIIYIWYILPKKSGRGIIVWEFTRVRETEAIVS